MFTGTRFSLERLAALDRAIRAGEYPNACSLAARLEVAPRTVQRDVEFLRDRLGAPLAYDEVRHGYYYTEPNFRMPSVVLTEGELVALFLAERVLRQYQNTPYAPDLARAFHKLTTALDEPVTVDLSDLDAACSFRTTLASGPDPALFLALTSARRRRQRVRLRYYSASRDVESEREVDPYHLACVDGHWYLIGLCHVRNEMRMFALGRIRALDEVEATFEPPADFRIKDYLAGAFAVLRGAEGESHRVRLRFTGESVRYVRERVWHPTQTIESDGENALVLTLDLGHLREVERWALSWGGDCEDLAPEALRQRVAGEFARAAARYPPSA
jgi:predicted DNA-binding transcriptional regulator YafY